MRRPLLWLLGGLVLFLLAAALLAPSELLPRAVGLSAVAIVPALALLALAGDQRRRRGHTDLDDTTDPGDE